MYKKVLFNIKKIKKIVGGREGQYLNPKHPQCILKKRRNKKKKKMAETGLEPTSFG